MNDTLIKPLTEAQLALDEQVDKILHYHYCTRDRCEHVLWRAKMNHEAKLNLVQWSNDNNG